MSILRSKRPILRQQQRQNPCGSAPPRQGNPVSVVGGGATVGVGGANAGTPVSVGNQQPSQFQSWNWNWQPWWGWGYPVWGCSPWSPYGCAPWGWPSYGYTGAPWPPGYAGIPYGYY